MFWGAGGAFCAGWDLKLAASLAGKPEPLTALDFPDDGGAAPRGPMGPSRLELSKPVIAAVAGPAVAGGFELALWCDLQGHGGGRLFRRLLPALGHPAHRRRHRAPAAACRPGPGPRHHPDRPQGRGRGGLSHRRSPSASRRSPLAARSPRRSRTRSPASRKTACAPTGARSTARHGLPVAGGAPQRMADLGPCARRGGRRRRGAVLVRQGRGRDFGATWQR